jgi:hypothetical protein
MQQPFSARGSTHVRSLSIKFSLSIEYLQVCIRLILFVFNRGCDINGVTVSSFILQLPVVKFFSPSSG